MKTGTHPDVTTITVSCACGHSADVLSTLKDNVRVEICSHCHPLYTGKSKLVDTAGRVDKFEARRKAALAHQQAAEARKQATEAKAESEKSE